MGLSDLQAKLAKKQADLEKYEDAIDNILSGGQSYNVNGQSFTRADIEAINSIMIRIENEIKELEYRIARIKYRGFVKAPLFMD